MSSIFDELKAEREALQREVFPTIRALCRQHGARFQVIDLRWESAKRQQAGYSTMAICLTEIDRCQQSGLPPNLWVLLGDRYGWRPSIVG